jgi:hypothetical protein
LGRRRCRLLRSNLDAAYVDVNRRLQRRGGNPWQFGGSRGISQRWPDGVALCLARHGFDRRWNSRMSTGNDLRFRR